MDLKTSFEGTLHPTLYPSHNSQEGAAGFMGIACIHHIPFISGYLCIKLYSIRGTMLDVYTHVYTYIYTHRYMSIYIYTCVVVTLFDETSSPN